MRCNGIHNVDRMKFASLRLVLSKADSAVTRWLFAGAAYAFPAIVGLLSLVALLQWDRQYPVDTPASLQFSLVKETQRPLTPPEALLALRSKPLVFRWDTNLSVAPFWLHLALPSEPRGLRSLEFPSRHSASIACWQVSSNGLTLLGEASRSNVSGGMSQVKAGFALALVDGTEDVLCRSQSVGPARITVDLWTTSQLALSEHQFHRTAGLLDGGLLVLAIFVLVAAVVNREPTYAVFAAWLIVNLRMGALSAGWDAQWLGHDVPQDWLLRSRLITTATYYTLTLVLFRALFQGELARIGSWFLLRISLWSCIPLLTMSMLLPYGTFLPFIWVATIFSIGVCGRLLLFMLLRNRSRVAMWYAGSMGLTLVASLYEVVSAALGVKGMLDMFNSVTAALASGLLASLAIAEQMRQEHQQRVDAQAELQHTFDAVPVGLFSLDLEGRFIGANPALLKMVGGQLKRVLTESWHQYFTMDSWTRIQELVHGQAGGELEIKDYAMPNGGAPRSYLVKATLSRGKIEGSLQDITERVLAIGHLQFLADNDSLTRSLNRRGIEEELGRAMEQLIQGRPLALAYLDLDRFKLINDLYGRNVGDEVLQHVCSRVNNVLSGYMRLGRLGGDEFLLVLPDTKIELATLICQRIIATLGNRPYDIDDKAFHVRGSIGLIEVAPGTSIKDAVSTADRACRQAKARNGDGLVVYEKGSPEFLDYEAEIRLVQLLATPEATRGLHLVMQPIMSLSAPHDSLNFEVLLRMSDPMGKPIRTDHLIQAAESSGRMSTIDRWVLSTTLSWLNAHYERLEHTKFICVNLNGASLNDERFLDDVVTMLTQNRRVAHLLCYEVTESVALHDLDNTRRFIERVRGFGAKVALDDFGAGYTSFSYLKDLPADLLKIDGNFIVDMNHHPANIAIVEAIVSLAGNLGMKTIAEWAEDNATVQTLHDIGVDYVQGYVVARPLAPEQLVTAISSASFIQDEQLLQMVSTFGKVEGAVLQVDLFEAPPPRKPH